MRLDHLLSKEHWPAGGFSWLVQSRARTVKVHQLWWVSGVRDGARGWNADQFGRVFVSAASTARSSGWVGNVVGMGVLVVGTLLGPEGAGMVGWPSGRSSRDVSSSDACLSVIPRVTCWLWVVWSGGGCGVGDRPYFENCTVDASIL